MLTPRIIGLLLCCGALAACRSQPIQPSPLHLHPERTDTLSQRDIPEVVRYYIPLPPPSGHRIERFNVVVQNLPVAQVLFTLARDANLNLDIHPAVQGNVTLNAIQQTLPQLLRRIGQQVALRYQQQNGSLSVLPDTPYLKHYQIDYLNISREIESSIHTSMQVGNRNSTQNSASTRLKDQSRNRFWQTLVQNIKDLLRETDKKLPPGSKETIVTQQKKQHSSAPIAKTARPHKTQQLEQADTMITRHSTIREAASVIANPENGLLAVRATARQHQQLQSFLHQVMQSARRQVMIEMTIVEVRLSDQYQQGINWSAVFSANGQSFKLHQSANTLFGNGMLGLISNPASNIRDSLALLASYGEIKVLSSPRLSVLNNQTALMRVVDNLVYFTIKADTVSNNDSATITTYTTTPNTVPVGFTLSVTPQISRHNEVLLKLRPSISRLIEYIPDPNPNLLNIHYQGVPQIQTREMESLLRLENLQIAVLGGLMQDRSSRFSDAVPGLEKIPGAGEAFRQRDEYSETTELVIFLRPTIINSAGLNGDYQALQSRLPDTHFFESPSHDTL